MNIYAQVRPRILVVVHSSTTSAEAIASRHREKFQLAKSFNGRKSKIFHSTYEAARALKKWEETIDYVSGISLHFFRASCSSRFLRFLQENRAQSRPLYLLINSLSYPRYLHSQKSLNSLESRLKAKGSQ